MEVAQHPAPSLVRLGGIKDDGTDDEESSQQQNALFTFYMLNAIVHCMLWRCSSAGRVNGRGLLLFKPCPAAPPVRIAAGRWA